MSEKDLEEIGDYIARESLQRAYSFIKEIRDRCFLVLQTPYGSPLRESLGDGTRYVSFDQYLIYYTVDEATDEVRIERILHAARDIDHSLFH